MCRSSSVYHDKTRAATSASEPFTTSWTLPDQSGGFCVAARGAVSVHATSRVPIRLVDLIVSSPGRDIENMHRSRAKASASRARGVAGAKDSEPQRYGEPTVANGH